MRAVLGEMISQTQSGTVSIQFVVGSSGRRDLRHPARSGTSIFLPNLTSGSYKIHHPPGPPRPPWKGLPISCVKDDPASACFGDGLACVKISPPSNSAVTLSG